jgi:hypothetical protein
MRTLLLVAMAGAVGLVAIGPAGAQEMPPAAPTELSAGTPIRPTDVYLLWRDNSDNEDTFRVERSTEGAGGPWTVLSQVPGQCLPSDATRCLYVDRELTPDTTYLYRVAAVNSADTSAYSNVASATTGALPTPAPGEIRGVVFHDANANGVRDTGEEGLSGSHISLLPAGESQTHTTGDLGEYGFGGLPVGDYTVLLDLHQRSFPACLGGISSFNPLERRSAACSTPLLPWKATTPATVNVTLNGGGARVDFGARPADVEVLIGNAILETDYAPRGTVIVALVSGQECGTTTVVGGSELDFDIEILGAGERTGCARPGDLVHFTVGGVPAISTATWRPFSDPREPVPFGFGNIVAMQQHAWYWFQGLGNDQPAAGTLVQAVINGVVCGEASVEAPPGSNIAGFSKLLVPSADLQPGCGRPGAMVSFLFDGVVTGDPIERRAGLQYINPFARPIFGTTGLPGAGSAPMGSAAPWPAALALAAGAALLASRAVLRRRR